jgi:hypothetical protein
VPVRNAAASALAVLYSACGLEAVAVAAGGGDGCVAADDGDDVDEFDAGNSAGRRAALHGAASAVGSEARQALTAGFHDVVARVDALACNRHVLAPHCAC